MERQGRENNRPFQFKMIWPIFVASLMLLAAANHLVVRDVTAAQSTLPIGQIQGRGFVSGYLDQPVRFRAIVTGILEDENARGARFYTVFAQDVPGSEDGDPQTSDGLAIFAGARRPAVAVGDIANFSGVVTEFYGLTEIDDSGLSISIESRNNSLPETAAIDPPSGNEEAAAYLERFEGMLVSLPQATVAGPAHVGCGFAVVAGHGVAERVMVSRLDDPAGQVLGVLHPSDVDCEAMPAVSYGDQLSGLAGPLTYHFDRFKVVYQDAASLSVAAAGLPLPSTPTAGDGQLVVATFNVNNYFDAFDDSGDDAEPKPAEAEVTLKRSKIAATIGRLLNCPDVLALQEVENEPLLAQLASEARVYCEFTYQISHLDGPDQRGADVALLTNPEQVEVIEVRARQACTELETELQDLMMVCPPDQQALFSRPPLQVTLQVADQPLVLLVNHFKSKRGGAEETAARRMAQAEHVQFLSKEIQLSLPEGHVIVTGDFNDYDGSPVMHALSGEGDLIDALASVATVERYSYIFDGASQLIDWILVSPSLAGRILRAGVVHSNADYPFQLGTVTNQERLAFRSSDHDIPYVVLDLRPAEMLATQSPMPSSTQEPSKPVSVTAAAQGRTPQAVATESTIFLPEAIAGVESTAAPLNADATPPASPPDMVSTTASTSSGTDQPFPSRVVLAAAGFFAAATVGLLVVAVVKARRP